MTGPEHYREAESLLDLANHIADAANPQDEGEPERTNAAIHVLMATAQVHATLALAAATALCHPGDDQTRPEDGNAWVDVAGVPFFTWADSADIKPQPSGGAA
ncbi:hypothetical protein [Acrocarpospora sp. B8E8]|uniref:hypothetical protein n=1 Tax=Acrocarpospora sp. B8E8 TaxID=3153572 RepID=UPI00325E8813